jgi:ABC-type nitrate/sulfonate/bicarbonate transport system substrate-binding protein
MSVLTWIRGIVVVAWILAVANLATAQEVTKITIGQSSPSLPASTAKLAKELGLFEKHGIDANVLAMDNASVATMGLISGSINFNSTAATEVVYAQAHGQKLVSVANLYGRFPAVLTIAKAVADKSGVSPTAPVNDRLKALDGLVIASPSATSTYTFALKPASEAAGAKVRLTYMAQPAMVAALDKGAIQGFIASSPFYALPVLAGNGVLWISGPHAEFPPQYSPANAITLNTRREYADANPQLMKRLVAVFADVAKAIDDRPADVKAAIARIFPDLDKKTIDLLFDTESPAFKTKPLTEEDMARAIAFVKSSGVQLPQIDKLEPAALLVR